MVSCGETTGFARASDSTESGLRSAAEAATAAARRGDDRTHTVALTRNDVTRRNSVDVYPDEVAKVDKVALLRHVDDAARSAGPAIVQVSAGYRNAASRSSSPTATACWPMTSWCAA